MKKTAEKAVLQGVKVLSRRFLPRENQIIIIQQAKERIAALKPDISAEYNYLSYNSPTSERRLKAPIQRFLQEKIGTSYATEQSIAEISEDIKHALFSYQLEILTGEDIYRAYRDKIGGGSCMTDCEADKVRLYCDNSQYAMQVLKAGNNTARAMLIELDSGQILQDRTYSNSTRLKALSYTLGLKAGRIVRKDSASDLYTKDGKLEDYTQLIVTLDNYNNGEMPYQDTLGNAQFINGQLILYHCRRKHPRPDIDYYGTNSTSGNYKTLWNCEHCGEEIEDSDCTYSEGGSRYCADCYSELFFTCDFCDREERRTFLRSGYGNPYRHNRSDIDSRHDICLHCATNHFTLCDCCGHRIHNDYISQAITGENVCNNCIDEYMENHAEEAETETETKTEEKE